MTTIKNIGFNTDHFVYEVTRQSRGRDGRCSRCKATFAVGDHVRVSGSLDDDGWWHEIPCGG